MHQENSAFQTLQGSLEEEITSEVYYVTMKNGALGL